MAERLAGDFPAVDLEAWRQKALAKTPDAETHTEVEGIAVPWLFTSDDVLAPDPGGVPADAPFVRGTRTGERWDIRQETIAPDRGAANAAVLEDLEGGATSVVLRLDRAAREGIAPDADGFREARGRDGVAVSTLDDLDEVLDGVYTDLAPVALEAGAQAVPAAALLIALCERRGHDLNEIGGSLGIDPLGTLAREGAVAGSPEDALAAAARTAAEVAELAPGVRALAADTTPFARAGATAVQELAVAIAIGAELLRACDAAGLAPREAARQIEFTVAVGPDQFLEMAKLRALRRAWARVLEACDVPAEDRHSRIVAKTSERSASAVDPWVNILRATTAGFAAAVAGADALTVTAFDRSRGVPGRLGRRIARNTQLILADESNLTRVADPGGGSWYVEWLTDRLARDGWEMMQEIERDGGALQAITSGALAERLATTATERAGDLAHRRRLLTGTSAFPLVGDDRVPAPDVPDLEALATAERERLLSERNGGSPVALDGEPTLRALIDAATAGARIDELAAALGAELHRSDPLPAAPDARPFEEMRAAAAATPPRILLAGLGPIAKHNTTATWTSNFFGVAGFEAELAAPLEGAEEIATAARETSAKQAVVCAARDEEPETLKAAVAALREGGVDYVFVAGAKPDAAEAAGADEGVRDGVDMLAVLGAALQREGIER